MDKKFINGVYVKIVDTQYGQIIKISGKTDIFVASLEEITKDDGFFRFEVKTSKNGNLYCQEDLFTKSVSESVMGDPSSVKHYTGSPVPEEETQDHKDDLPF